MATESEEKPRVYIRGIFITEDAVYTMLALFCVALCIYLIATAHITVQ